MDTSVQFSDPAQQERYDAYIKNLREDEFAMALMADRLTRFFSQTMENAA